jgi:hypothetical protein
MQSLPTAGPERPVHAFNRRSRGLVRPRFKEPQKNGPDLAPFSMSAVGGGDNCEDHPFHMPGIPPDGHPLRRLALLRQEAAREIERLLAFLDATDGDVDAEALDEPTDAEIHHVVRYGVAGNADLEDDEDGGDNEPSLGSHEIREAGAVSYCPSVAFGWFDVEGEHDGQEPAFCGLTADRASHASALGAL